MAAQTASSAGGLGVPRPKNRFARRLSSQSVTKEDLAGGPTIVVPPERMDGNGGDAHELASAMEHARRGMEGLSTDDDDQFKVELLQPQTTDKYAFAFDIDGVLIRGGKPIPEAVHAMKMLNGLNNRGIKV